MQRLHKVETYFPSLSSTQLNQLELYCNLLIESNQHVNLISRKDIKHVEIHHILHSLSIAKFKTFTQSDRVLDVGTGGGLPGIPLAIVFPETQFFLIDTLLRKIKKVEWMIEQLQLNNVVAIHGRMEKLNQTFDYIVSRAVTQIPRLIAWSRKLVDMRKRENGMIMLKGGDVQTESAGISYPIKIVPVSTYYTELFFKEKYIVYVSMLN